MPRRPRIHVPGGFYHVTLRGNHRQAIFYCNDDRRLLGNIVAQTITHYPARVHAYCWMENHIHMLMQAGEMPLGRIILRIASRYARLVQSRLETTGHLFERRYHAVLVDADAYLLELLRYIHLNPVRAGIVVRPDDFPWSSHHAYVGARNEPWVTTDFALRMWGEGRDMAVARYRSFVGSQSEPASHSPLSRVNPEDSRVLGNDDFLGKIRADDHRTRPDRTLDSLIEETCNRYGVAVEDLCSDMRQRRLTRIRASVAHQAITQRIASMSEVARRLCRGEASLRELVLRHYPPGAG